jgi:hypothetical protein
MHGSREKYGVHSTPPSALHQQPHNGGMSTASASKHCHLKPYTVDSDLIGGVVLTDLPQI